MGMKTKLYFSVASTILFAIAVIIFFINGNPQKWFWLCIFASIIQNIVLLKRTKKRIKIFKLLTYLCRLSSFVENAFIQFYNKSMFLQISKTMNREMIQC